MTIIQELAAPLPPDCGSPRETRDAAPGAKTPPAEGPLSAGRSLLATAARRGVLVLVDQAIVSGTSFLTSVILARACGADGLGLYSLCLSAVLLSMGVQASLVATPYTVLYHRLSGRNQRRYAGSSLVQHLGISLAATAMFAGAGVLLLIIGGQQGFASMAFVLATVLPFLLLREFVRRMSLAHFQLRTVLILDFAVAALQLSLLVLLAIGGRLTPVAAYLVIGVSCLAAAFPALLSLRGLFAMRWSRYWSDLRRNWSFGRWVLGGQTTFLLTAYSLPWLLAVWQGTEETGVFAACMSVVMILNPLVQGICNYLGPQAAKSFSEGGIEDLRQVTSYAACLFGVLIGGFALTMIVAGGPIAVSLYGESFRDSHSIIGLLAIGLFVYTLGMVADIGLWAMGLPQVNFAANLLGMAVTIGGGALLIAYLALPGAALASLLGTTAAAVVKVGIFLHQIRQPSPVGA
jgi:O-antigen/teichoic acid export membrane protein